MELLPIDINKLEAYSVGKLSLEAINFKSLHEHINNTSAIGKPTFHIFSGLASSKEEDFHQRTIKGLRGDRARKKAILFQHSIKGYIIIQPYFI